MWHKFFEMLGICAGVSFVVYFIGIIAKKYWGYKSYFIHYTIQIIYNNTCYVFCTFVIELYKNCDKIFPISVISIRSEQPAMLA